MLERDRNLTRNFREETVTDLLMASMVGLESFGIRVDFPDEPTTGGDMEWIYAAPLEVNGGRYLRLMLQAKRAQYAERKRNSYWFYQHLDHGNPLGQQAQTLVGQAGSSPGGVTTLPLYIFYHATSATEPATRTLPAVEGINLVFADLVAPVVKGGCKIKDKKVERWRQHFLPLSELLCWPVAVTALPPPAPVGVTRFVVGGIEARLALLTGGFHPDLVAARLNERRSAARPPAAAGLPQPRPIDPAESIPDDIRRAIDGKMTSEDRQGLKRPRVILTTRLTRESPDFKTVDALSRRSDN
jgi:hypothetical protein